MSFLAKNVVAKGLLLRNAGIVSRAAYHHGDGHDRSTMNDLPVPEGDWQEHHSCRNSKYNTVLLTGILALVGTIAFAKSTGVIYLNYTPPKSLD